MFAKFEHELKERLRDELTKEKVSKASVDRVLGAVFGSSGRAATSGGDGLQPPASLPLLLKKDILNQADSIRKHLSGIQAALGLPVEVSLVGDFDWEGIEQSQADNQGWRGKPGQIWERLMGHLVNNIKKLAATDMSREAVVDVWTTGQIRLIINPSAKWNSPNPKAWDEVFVDGVLEITCQNPLTAEGQIGTWIESHL